MLYANSNCSNTNVSLWVRLGRRLEPALSSGPAILRKIYDCLILHLFIDPVSSAEIVMWLQLQEWWVFQVIVTVFAWRDWRKLRKFSEDGPDIGIYISVGQPTSRLLRPEEGGSIFIRNVGACLRVDTTSIPTSSSTKYAAARISNLTYTWYNNKFFN